jgi:hypothetical protein
MYRALTRKAEELSSRGCFRYEWSWLGTVSRTIHCQNKFKQSSSFVKNLENSLTTSFISIANTWDSFMNNILRETQSS